MNPLKQRLDAPCRFRESPRSCTSLHTFINHNVPAKHMQNIACLSNAPMNVVCLKETERYVAADCLALWCQLNILCAFANADQNGPTCSARAIRKTRALTSGPEQHLLQHVMAHCLHSMNIFYLPDALTNKPAICTTLLLWSCCNKDSCFLSSSKLYSCHSHPELKKIVVWRPIDIHLYHGELHQSVFDFSTPKPLSLSLPVSVCI